MALPLIYFIIMPGGRPSKYKKLSEADLARVLKYLQKGATIQEVAEFLEIHRDTVHDWMNNHKEFSDIIKNGRDMADDKVEQSFFKRATGFTKKVEEVHRGEVVRVKKYFPPADVPGIFWLKNRRPGRWKDKQVIEHEGGVEIGDARDRLLERIMELKKSKEDKG